MNFKNIFWKQGSAWLRKIAFFRVWFHWMAITATMRRNNWILLTFLENVCIFFLVQKNQFLVIKPSIYRKQKKIIKKSGDKAIDRKFRSKPQNKKNRVRHYACNLCSHVLRTLDLKQTYNCFRMQCIYDANCVPLTPTPTV